MRTFSSCIKLVTTAVVVLAALASLGMAYAGVTVVYAFRGGKDGALPESVLIQDKAGDFYGTTRWGGSHGCNGGSGTVFKLAPDGNETVLHAFKCCAFPSSGLVADSAGNLYGTTDQGGVYGQGIVFRLAPDGTETVLHAFDGDDGVSPQGSLSADKAGNLYGTAAGGGRHCCNRGAGDGLAFKLTPDGAETVLYAFGRDKHDGTTPKSGLIRDKAGNFYGTTVAGGRENCKTKFSRGCGTVFRIAPDGTETVLYAFAGGRGGDGAAPRAEVIEDKAGNLYGTTERGGGTGCKQTPEPPGCGTVFELAPDGTETVLHAFMGGKDGAYPDAALFRDDAGNLYGTTSAGGGGCQFEHGCGTVFMLAPDGTETVLYAFGKNQRRGATPQAGLMKGADGELYGTASWGGANCEFVAGCGTVFRLKK